MISPSSQTSGLSANATNPTVCQIRHSVNRRSRSSVYRLSRWSGGRWTFAHGVGYHGLGDLFYEFGRASADTQAAFVDAVNATAFFLTNSCTLSGACPVSVCTSSDIRS